SARLRLGLAGPSLGEVKKACTDGDVSRLHGWLVEMRQAASARLLVEAGEPPLPTLVLPVDQGEELFGVDAGDEAPRFLELVAALAAQNRDDAHRDTSELIVALTIRTDRYSALQSASQLATVKTVVFDELKPMPRTRFKEVITGPAERATEGGHAVELE